MQKPRNPVARTALLRKGGVHRKSRSAERHKARRELHRELREPIDRGRKAPVHAVVVVA